MKKFCITIIMMLILSVFTETGSAFSPKIWKEPITGMEFIWIELPEGGFWMGKYEVTNAQYRKYKPGHNSGVYGKESLNGAKQPVVFVDWEDADSFAKWLTNMNKGRYQFRLPKEYEWEYACRAGNYSSRFWGDNQDDACKYANVHDRTSKQINRFDWQNHQCNDGYAVTAPVGRFKPNRFGLYDMIGNVWEWCEEIYRKDEQYIKDPDNPLYYGTMSRVSRGGGWSDDPPSVCCNFRDGFSSVFKGAYVGFRLLRIH